MPIVSFAALKVEGVDQDLPVMMLSTRFLREAGLPEEETAFVVASEAANPAAPAPELVPGLSFIVSPRLGTYVVHRLEGAIAVMQPEDFELYLSAAGAAYIARAERLDLGELRARRRSECC
jgi:hypothetical protein